MLFVSRTQWGAHPPKSTSTDIKPAGVTIHWEGPRMGTFPHSQCASKVRGIQAYHQDTQKWADIAYCVDETTEILSERGWLAYQDLREGDVVLTLNHETGLSEWQPVLEVCVFPAATREMVLMEGHHHSSLTTPNHRWPVERYTRRQGSTKVRTGQLERRWVTTETFGYWDRIPVSARGADLPTDPKWSDALVELVAWFWTEGHIIRRQDGSQSTRVMICQSRKAEDNVARIRAALHGVFGDASVTLRGSSAAGAARWREAANGHKMEWYLSSDAGQVLCEIAPNRVTRLDFLRSLTQAQLDLYVATSLEADGHRNHLAQKNRAAAESFQVAAVLAGHRTSLHPRKPTKSTAYVMWGVGVLSGTHIAPRPSAAHPDGRFKIQNVQHDGIVWCPRTPNMTWLARRNGTTYFTGNTAIVCPHGYVYEGRGIGKRTAANGTNAGNDEWYAVCALAGVGDVTTPELLAGLDDAIHWLRGHGGAGVKVNGHRDHKPTDCPGDVLYKWAHTGTHDTTTAPEKKDTPVMFLAKDPTGNTQYLVDGGHVTALNPYLYDQLKAVGVPQITVQSLAQITESFSQDDELATAMRRQLSVGGQVVEINKKVDALVAAPVVDAAAIAAGVLEGLSPEAIAAAIPTDLAEQVADTLAARLTKDS